MEIIPICRSGTQGGLIEDKPFVCDQCGRKFKQKLYLKNHHRIHSKQKLSPNAVCNKNIRQKDTLQLYNAHAGEKNKSSIIHLKDFKQEGALEKHDSNPQNKIITFESFVEIIPKCRSVTQGGSIEDKPYVCDQCGRQFKQKLYLKNHYRSHSKQKLSPNTVCNKNIRQKDTLQLYNAHAGEKNKSSIIHLKEFKQEGALEKHDSNPQNVIITFESFAEIIPKCRSVTRGGLIEDKPYVCDQCGRQFRKKLFLKNHYRIHSKQKLSSNAVCKKNIRQKDTLQLYNSVHGGEKNKSSIVHLKEFKQEGALEKHDSNHPNIINTSESFMEIIPICRSGTQGGLIEDKPFVCDQCGRKFKQKFYLKNHYRIHSKQKLSPNAVCNNNIRQKDTLQLYNSAHAGEKNKSSIIHLKDFKQEEALEKHDRNPQIITFESFAEIIPKCRSVTRGGLIEDKPYVCDQCGRQFKKQLFLKNHYRIHSKQKLSSNAVCNKNIKRKDTLQLYNSVHAGKKNKSSIIHRKEFKQEGAVEKHDSNHPNIISTSESFTEIIPICRSGTQGDLIENKPFVCDQCGKKFKLNMHLKNHYRIHSKQKLSPSAVCDKDISQKGTLQLYNSAHTGEKNKSSILHLKNFKQEGTLEKHDSNHQKDYPNIINTSESFTEIVPVCKSVTQGGSIEDKPMSYSYVCDQCGRKFKQKCNLKSHCCTSSKQKLLPSFEKHNSNHLKMINTSKSDGGDNKIKSFQCDKCGKRFYQKGNLKTHYLIHTGEKPYSCEKCGKTFNQKGNLQVHYLVHTGEKQYTCDQCDKTFSQKGNLQLHYLVHTGEKPHTCDQCGEMFSQKGNLQNHYLVHTGKKQYTCDQCGKMFSQKGNLRNHYLVHTGEKPYTCDQCGKMFGQKGNLQLHYLVHTGEKQYTCDQCDKTFSQKGHLAIHYSIHSKEKPYSCDLCDKRFNQQISLKQHYLFHTGEKPYSCEKCNKNFRLKRSLKLHYIIHTNEKPYPCNICDKKFSQKVQLVRHYSIHAREKLYSCKKCNETFSRKSSLKIHYHTHTKRKFYSCVFCHKHYTYKVALEKHYLDHN